MADPQTERQARFSGLLSGVDRTMLEVLELAPPRPGAGVDDIVVVRLVAPSAVVAFDGRLEDLADLAVELTNRLGQLQVARIARRARAEDGPLDVVTAGVAHPDLRHDQEEPDAPPMSWAQVLEAGGMLPRRSDLELLDGPEVPPNPPIPQERS
jgi:hypothetical protein